MGNRPKQADTVLIAGTTVRDLRLKADLTQGQLATEVNKSWHLSRGYLPSLEEKPTARVHKQLAEALATALDVTVNELRAAVPQRRRRKAKTRFIPLSQVRATGSRRSPLAVDSEDEPATSTR
jgi:hypothetical protein